jgi:CRISPR/Cas system-associated exonuclease Cas4 (RecB family)
MVIDLLIEESGGFVVVDYKSSNAHKEEHIAQVKAYLQAIKATTHQEARGAIFYLLAQEIVMEWID